MTSEERLDRIERIIEKQTGNIDGLIGVTRTQNDTIQAQNDGIQALLAVGRTCLDSIKELPEIQQKDHDEWAARMNELREAQAATDGKLNILIDTVDKIIRHGQEPNGREG